MLYVRVVMTNGSTYICLYICLPWRSDDMMSLIVQKNIRLLPKSLNMTSFGVLILHLLPQSLLRSILGKIEWL